MKKNEDKSTEVSVTLYFKDGYRNPFVGEGEDEVFIHRDYSPPSLRTGEYHCSALVSLKTETFDALVKVAKEKSGNRTDFDYLRDTNKALYDGVKILILEETPDFSDVILREFPSEVLEAAANK